MQLNLVDVKIYTLPNQLDNILKSKNIKLELLLTILLLKLLETTLIKNRESLTNTKNTKTILKI